MKSSSTPLLVVVLGLYILAVGCGLLGCSTPQAVKPIAEKNTLLPTSCPELSQIAPKDFGQTVLMLEQTSQQYYVCRKAALADQGEKTP